MDIIIKYNSRASMKDLAKWRPSWMAGIGAQDGQSFMLAHISIYGHDVLYGYIWIRQYGNVL